jgi:DNA-binding LytR/AlgR family response regulator
MKVIIIEDEKLSAEHLTMLLKRIDAEIEVIHLFDSVKSSVKAFQQGITADLLFLDIHLADGLSFEILSQTTIDCPIVFTTAYDDYAIKAFKHNSVDYLLKPVGLEDLKSALVKYKKYNQKIQSTLVENISLAYQQITKQYKQRFLVKLGQTIDSIKTEDAIHFQTNDSITFLVTSNGKRYPIDYTLDQLDALLSPELFFRINRKVMMNIKSIGKVSTYFNSRLIITTQHLDQEASVVSRDRVNDFKAWLDQ